MSLILITVLLLREKCGS